MLEYQGWTHTATSLFALEEETLFIPKSINNPFPLVKPIPRHQINYRNIGQTVFKKVIVTSIIQHIGVGRGSALLAQSGPFCRHTSPCWNLF